MEALLIGIVFMLLMAVGVPIGTAVGIDTDMVRDLVQHYDFVLVANDASLLGQGARSVLTTIKTH